MLHCQCLLFLSTKPGVNQAHTYNEKAWFVLSTAARNADTSNHTWILLLFSPPVRKTKQTKNPKPNTLKKNRSAVDVPTEAEKQSFVGFEGLAHGWLLGLVGCRSACLLCCCWRPCGELGVCLHSRCALRKSVNKGCGKRKKKKRLRPQCLLQQSKNDQYRNKNSCCLLFTNH